MFHYTYEIVYSTGLRYIGSRSSKVRPEEDTSYWGSSKYTPSNDNTKEKIILSTFITRKEALKHEVYLHKYNNISKNDRYYNKARQETSGFTCSGLKKTQTWKDKIGNANRGKKRTKEQCSHISKSRKGKSTGPRTQKTKDKQSVALKGKHLKYPDKYNWINSQTKETRNATCNEMADEFCINFSGNFTAIIRKRYKSYHKWELNNEQ